ncbi:2OG-Fe(II) oxygenase [Paenibacillus oleatilyticus]|uniref:2OG-Fe(II) oxygenase n=1 Tax=Paenibacillus oleatilyticus TaxID=2594886 RepID=UPI001C1F7C95|nr:2OG-Fe(II) oxygenase [Paenibacillus oleatilyticus]MBU7314844.1 2OG-Fe(II) oxygenase [Paenibacillus oleatilyticus]
MREPSVVFHEEPLVASYEQAVSGPECRQLIELARHQLEPAKVIGEKEVVASEFRKSEFAWFHHDSHPLVREVSERLAALVGRPLHYAESLQIARYGVGGKFGAHFDTYDLNTVDGKRFYDQGGQRLYTALLYLNTVDAGGETYFPELNLDIAPSEGALIVFETCKRGTNESHPLSLHGSRELREGEKWIATLWFRERPQYEPRQAASDPQETAPSVPAMMPPAKADRQMEARKLQEVVADRKQEPSRLGEPSKLQAKVVAMGGSGKREIQIRGFQITTDVIPEAGEQYGLGPGPAEMMLGALGSGIVQVALSLAAARGITLQYLDVEVTGELSSEDALTPAALCNISYKLNVLSPHSTDEIMRLHKAVERSCPSLHLLADPQQINGSFAHIKTSG